MGLILKAGFGIKKIVLPIGKRTFKTIKEDENHNGIIRVKKTENTAVNNKWLIEQYMFEYYDEKDNLKSYLLGNPEGEKFFYVQEIKSIKSNVPTTSTPLKLVYSKVKKRISSHLGIKVKKAPCPSFERNLLFLWDYTKNFLEKSGVNRLVTQAEFEAADLAEIDFKVGWRDVDRGRRLEQYVGNIEERQKHYTTLEKIFGAIYLEYPLKNSD